MRHQPDLPRERPGGDAAVDFAKVAAARARPMSERLELALSWNSVAAELRAGVARATGAEQRPPR
ncbi:MAG: hypothetical protein ACR2HC_09115 [Thermoleophilaceae bacterium]